MTTHLSGSLLMPLFTAFYLRSSVLSTPFKLARHHLSRHLSITSFMPSLRFPSPRTYNRYGSLRPRLVRAVVPQPLVRAPPSHHPAAALPRTHHASHLATTAPSTSQSPCSPLAAAPSHVLPHPRARRAHPITTPSSTRSVSSNSRFRITSRAQSSPTTPRCAQPPRPRATARWTSCSRRS